MSRSNTTDKFVQQYMAALHEGLSLQQFADALDIKPESVIRRRNKIKEELGFKLKDLPKDAKNPDIDLPDDWKESVERKQYDIVDRRNSKRKRYVITSAQNATPVFKPFLKTLEKYCRHMEAELLVIPYRYKNPTSIWLDKDRGQDWWDKTITKYLVNDYVQIHDRLRVMGHIKIQPTAVNPLSGFDSYTGSDSAIFGHPKIQLKTVPTPSKTLPKILATTGTITKENYTDSKAGHKGYFHHSHGAIVVEISETGNFHIRHIHGDDRGHFYDLDKHFTQNSVKEGCTIAGLVTGDSHAEFIDDGVQAATYDNSDSIVNLLKPEKLVYHDVEDFYRRNHHHRGHHLLQYGKHHHGRDNVEDGLQITADFIDRNTRPWMENVVVKSNHDEALDRWLREADPKTDPENARLYYYLMYHLVSSVEKTDTGVKWADPFVFWCKNPDQQRGLESVDKTTFLHRDESYQIVDIEISFHGDKGMNGGRGSAKSFTKIGPKTVIGHSHSPGIEEGVYQVGVSAKLNMEYVSGPSSWLNTHCIIYPDGKRTLVHIINGEWKR